MEKYISELAETLFDGYPHTSKNQSLKTKLTEELQNQHRAYLVAGLNDLQAMKILLNDYETLESALPLIGSTTLDVDVESDESRIDLRDFTKLLKNIKIISYIGNVSLVIGFFELIFGLCTVFLYKSHLSPFIIIPIIIALICYIKNNKTVHKYPLLQLNSESYNLLLKNNDYYKKHLLNSIFIITPTLSYIVFYCIMLSINSHYTNIEIFQQIITLSTIIKVVTYIFIKNLYLRKQLSTIFPIDNDALFTKRFFQVSGISILYWVVIDTLLITLLSNSYYMNYYIVATVVYIFAALIYDLTLRREVVIKNIDLSKKKVAAISITLILVLGYQVLSMDSWLIQPYISKISTVDHVDDVISYNEDNGVYSITTGKDAFRILQLTDIHLGGSSVSIIKDYKALEACYDLIEYAKPDLVIVTGDLVFPLGIMSYSINNETPMMQFASFMRNIGIPWAFAYGNHDTETVAKSSPAEIDELLKSVSYKTSKNFLYPYIQPDITGRNNQLIELRRLDGTLNQALFLLDSNDYTGEGVNAYDYIHDDEVNWYKEQVVRLNEQEGKTVSSMCFFHMPLQEYKTAYELYESGNKDIKYYFGKNGESMIDKVCCSKYPSKLFDTALKLGSTKAMFCGHDHYNNLSVDYKGIRLTYGMSIDYLAMPGIDKNTDQRGATIIDINNDESFDIQQIKLTDIQNKGERLI